jgi:NADH-quinone oxidoreductase subunit N
MSVLAQPVPFPTGVQAVDWAALSPLVVPAVAMLVVLLAHVIMPVAMDAGAVGSQDLRHPGRRRVLDVIALAGIVGSGVALALTGRTPTSTLCIQTEGSGPTSLLSACSYATGPLTTALQGVVLIAALVCLLLALDGPGARARPEHHAMLLAATVGALALAGARDLATIVIAVETATLPVVALVALRRDAVGAQAAIKLLLVSIVSFAVLFLGVALVYAGAGTVHLVPLATTAPAHPELVAMGAALAVAGLAYKLSAAPFGWWTPDVYAGSPVPVAAFLSTVSKVAGLAGVIVVLGIGLPAVLDTWSVVVGVLAVVTMTLGNLVALRQRLAVRLLAWSTIAQAGWVLLPLAGAGAGLRAAMEASVGYLLAYVVASLAAFAVVILVTRHHEAGSAHAIEDYRSLARREPVAAAALGFALLCLAGLPPGVMGLVAKVVALRPVVDAGLWWLAALAAVNVALGLPYYLRWAAIMLAPVADEARPAARPLTWSVTVPEGLALGIGAGACVALSVLPQLVAGPFLS